MSLATLFTACACATSSSVLFFAVLPSKAKLESANPLPRAALLASGSAQPKVAASDPGAVLRLIRDSSELRLLMVAQLCMGVQYSYVSGSLNADVVAPSLGTAWIGYTNAAMQGVTAVASPIVGRLSDVHGRLPVYAALKSIDFASAVFVWHYYSSGTSSIMPAWMVFSLMVARGLSIAGAVVLAAAVAAQFEEHLTTTAFAACWFCGITSNALLWLCGPSLGIGAKSLLVASLAATAVAALALVLKRKPPGV